MKKLNVILFILILLSILGLIFLKQSLKFFIIESGSMKPTLKIEEMIVVKQFDEYKIDDIVTYYDEEFKGYVTHRIIEIEKNGKFITKGDFNNTYDEKSIGTNEIVGKVIFHSKILGLLFYKYKVITIVVILRSFILLNLYSIIFNERKELKWKN